MPHDCLGLRQSIKYSFRFIEKLRLNIELTKIGAVKYLVTEDTDEQKRKRRPQRW
jgi:hypothetical protein